jgi:hypothetical protein
MSFPLPLAAGGSIAVYAFSPKVTRSGKQGKPKMDQKVHQAADWNKYSPVAFSRDA